MILYATLFNTCMLVIATMRLFLWQLLLRQGVMREIKRLELRLLELAKNAGSAPASPSERPGQPAFLGRHARIEVIRVKCAVDRQMDFDSKPVN